MFGAQGLHQRVQAMWSEGRSKAEMRASLAGAFDAAQTDRALVRYPEPAVYERYRGVNAVLVAALAFALLMKVLILGIMMTEAASRFGDRAALLWPLVLLGLLVPAGALYFTAKGRLEGYLLILFGLVLGFGSSLSSIVADAALVDLAVNVGVGALALYLGWQLHWGPGRQAGGVARPT